MKIKVVINGNSIEVEIDKDKFVDIYLKEDYLVKTIQEIIKALKEE
jgi:hypothetical protein